MSAGEWHVVCPSDELAEGALRGRLIAGARLCVGRSPSGPFVVSDTCPHAGGSLSEGMLDGNEVICPLHGWAFDVATGRCVEDEQCALRVYETRSASGVLEVLV